MSGFKKTAYLLFLATLCLATFVILLLIKKDRQIRKEIQLTKLANQEISEKNIALENLAHNDFLTQLPNRMSFNEQLRKVLAHAVRNNLQVALLFIDLDRFKMVNDTHGHHVGDNILVETGRRLVEIVREDDIVSRLGGDEFTVILYQDPSLLAAIDHSQTIAKRIIETISQVYLVDGIENFISASIGIAFFPRDETNADELLVKADIAMYKAKELGKNQFQFYSSDIGDEARTRIELETDLRRAISENQFELYFQPKWFTKDPPEIYGLEALIRWNHPEKGLLAPGLFIAILETTGLIQQVGDWVIEESLRCFKFWQQARHGT